LVVRSLFVSSADVTPSVRGLRIRRTAAVMRRGSMNLHAGFDRMMRVKAARSSSPDLWSCHPTKRYA
jgi:hypothetical protein